MKRYWVLVEQDGTVKNVIERAFAPYPGLVTEIHWGHRNWFDAVDVAAENEEEAKSKALAAIDAAMNAETIEDIDGRQV